LPPAVSGVVVFVKAIASHTRSGNDHCRVGLTRREERRGESSACRAVLPALPALEPESELEPERGTRDIVIDAVTNVFCEFAVGVEIGSHSEQYTN